jgi:hypothetical protein
MKVNQQQKLNQLKRRINANLALCPLSEEDAGELESWKEISHKIDIKKASNDS